MAKGLLVLVWTLTALAVMALESPTWPLIALSLGGLLGLWGGTRPHPLRGATMLSLAAFALYLSTGGLHVTPDTLPVRYLPFSLLRHGNFYLDDSPLAREDNPYYLRRVQGHRLNTYSPAPALLALPFYLPSVVRGSGPPPEVLEKISAAGIVALSVGLVFLALNRVASPRMALFATLAYAFGSGSLSTSSQGMWQHGPVQLSMAAALLSIVSGRVAWAGFPLAWAVVFRPLALLLVAPLTLYVFLHHRRHTLRFVLWALPALAFQLWYNTVYFGGPLNLSVGPNGMATDEWSTPMWQGAAGNLFSPGRGLLVYSPVFLFSLLGMALTRDPLVRWLALACALLVGVVGKFIIWWGGDCFGPRYMADLGPLLAFCMYPAEGWLTRSRVLRLLAGLTLLVSITINLLGAFSDDAWLWSQDMNVNGHPERLWSWSNNPLTVPPLRLLSRLRLAREGLPTSLAAPGLLAATYSQAATRLHDGRLELDLTMRNVGAAVWLTQGQEQGRIRLGWRYFRNDPTRLMEGRVGLQRDIFPGETCEVHTSLALPGQPGLYRLEVGLVSENVAWFADLGSPPVWFEVVVTPEEF